MVASEAKSVGDALKHTGGADTLSLAASGDVVVAVYMDADRAASETDTPYKSVMLTTNGILWEAEVETGTALASMVDDEVDLASADGLDVTASTNDDFIILKVLSGTRVVGIFNKTVFNAGT
jgi:hypothetical protein